MVHTVCHLGEKSTSELLLLNDDIHTRPLSSLFHHLLGPEHDPSCVLVFPLSRRIHKTRRQARSPPEARSRIRLGSTIRSMARQHLCTTMHFRLRLQSGRCGGRNQLWRRPASHQRYNKTMSTAGGALRSRATQSSLYSTGWRARGQA